MMVVSSLSIVSILG